jgi:hypothetical protein
MTTINETISRVRNLLKGVNEDAFITDRFIYTVILKYSKALIRRQDNESKLMQFDSLFQVLPYVELIEVDTIEADCAGIKTGCTIMRTKNKLPKAFNGSIGPIFRAITPIDGSDTFQQTRSAIYVAFNKSTNFKYNKTKYFWYRNGYLYFPNITWDAVSIEGMWEEPIGDYCGVDTDACVQVQDTDFNIPDYLYAEIEQMSINEIMNLGKIPLDASDDSQNILR